MLEETREGRAEDRSVGKFLALWHALGTPWSQAFRALERSKPSLHSRVLLVSKDSALVDPVKVVLPNLCGKLPYLCGFSWNLPPQSSKSFQGRLHGLRWCNWGIPFPGGGGGDEGSVASSLIVLAWVKISFCVQVCPSELLHPQVLRLSWVTGQEHTLQ